MESPLREKADALGATWGEVGARRVPLRYGAGVGEYTAVRSAVGIVDRSDQAQIRLWGRDPVRMVQGLITNDLAGAPPGRGVYAAMLSAKGRTLAELRAFRRETAGPEVLLDLPREALAGTTEHLKKFVPPLFARWADVSEEMGCIGVYGPHARELLRRLGAGLDEPIAEDAFAEVVIEGAPLLLVGTRYAGLEEGYDLLAAAAAMPALWDALLARGAELGAHAVGLDTLQTLRVEAGRPRYGWELTEEVIPTEALESTGLMERAISFSKGCYTGQEVIVRIAHRGHVNRHLRGLLLGELTPPPPRTPLHHRESGKQVGWTASATRSPLLAEVIALGYVRREIAPGDAVRLGAPDGPEVRVTVLPFSQETADRHRGA
jgi:tRNA-modifying protein YgfZ